MLDETPSGFMPKELEEQPITGQLTSAFLAFGFSLCGVTITVIYV